MDTNDNKLVLLFNRVNRLYFDEGLEINGIFWSASRTLIANNCRKNCWAICNPNTRIIIINMLLKNKMPRYAMEYLIYHESLHFKWIYHCVSFRLAEQKFKHYLKAEKWLKANEARIFGY